VSARLRASSLLIGVAVSLISAWTTQSIQAADTANPPAAPLKYEEPKLLTATIYAQDSGRQQVLFKFKRVATRSGSELSVLREYTYPDGRPAARERVVYNGDDMSSYALEELQIGAAGAVKVLRDRSNPAKSVLQFEYTKDLASGRKPKTSTEPLRNDTLTSDMVGTFLGAHWSELANGSKLKCRYVVVPRRETVGFTFVKERETTSQGRRAVIIKMEATSPIIAQLVDPLFFTLEAESPHGVLEYTGRVTPKARVGNKWDDLDATCVFDWPGR
jgi:hypothetical protein